MPVVELKARDRTRAEGRWLREYRHRVHSQRGEDGMLLRLFELLGPGDRYAVEFGAQDGLVNSNTRHLFLDHGWQGLLLEPDAGAFARLSANYADLAGRVTLVNRAVALAGNTLDHLLTQAGAPPRPDLVSIDVDGLDLHIWATLEQFRPRVLVIEFNPCIANDLVYIQDPDPAVQQGSSLRAMVELGARKGYRLAGTTEWNALFVTDEEFPRLSMPDCDLDAIHDDRPFQLRLFQLYDGRLELAGYTTLLWNGWPICADDLQVVPRALRRFLPRAHQRFRAMWAGED